MNPYQKSFKRHFSHGWALSGAQRELMRRLRDEARGICALRQRRQPLGAVHAELLWCAASARLSRRFKNARGILKIATELREKAVSCSNLAN